MQQAVPDGKQRQLDAVLDVAFFVKQWRVMWAHFERILEPLFLAQRFDGRHSRRAERRKQ